MGGKALLYVRIADPTMMAPEQAEEAAAATAPGLNGLFDDAHPGCEVSDRRAPLGPPPEQQERVQQAAIEAGRGVRQARHQLF